MVIGIAGAFVGGWLANAMNLRLGEVIEGWFWGNLLVSVVGAVILITGYRLIRGRSLDHSGGGAIMNLVLV